MPDQDNAQLARGRRGTAAQDMSGTIERFETWMAQLPELRVLLAWGADARQVAEALIRTGARLYAMIGENEIAGRIEDAIERKTTPGKEPIWTKERSQSGFVETMAKEITHQTRPNVAAAARAVAAQEPYRAEGITAEAIRHEWIKMAKLNGATGTELAFQVWQDARGRTKPPS